MDANAHLDAPVWREHPHDDFRFLVNLLDDAREDSDSEGSIPSRGSLAIVDKAEMQGESVKDLSLAAERKKRRQEYARQYYRKTHPFSPIFKNDIRRQIGRMWVNVLNWNDPYMTKRFLTHVSVKDCAHVNVFHTPPHIRGLFPTIKDMTHVQQAILHGAYNAVTTPDVSCRIIQYQVVQSTKEPGTTVSVLVKFYGTKTFDFGSPGSRSLEWLQSLLDSASLGDPEAGEDRQGCLFDGLPGVTLNRLLALRVPLEKPIALEADGVFVLKLNEQHRLVSHVFHWKRVVVQAESFGDFDGAISV